MLLGFALSVFALGCGGDDENEPYNNQVVLVCGDSELLNMTFTSLDACETFRSQNTFECNDVPLDIVC